MAGKRSERTRKMIKQFYGLRNSGYSIRQIAEMFNLDPATVYSYLGEIAEREGVDRNSLLDRVFEADHTGSQFTPVRLVNAKEATSRINAMTKEAEALQARLSYVITEAEEFAKNHGSEAQDEAII